MTWAIECEWTEDDTRRLTWFRERRTQIIVTFNTELRAQLFIDNLSNREAWQSTLTPREFTP